jgi:hypothetical protein
MERSMRVTRVLREGFWAGCIGAGSVAAWFFVVDLVNQRPFFTPAMLGSAVFWGATNPAMVVIEFSRVVGYTMIHVSAFVVLGTIVAALTAQAEDTPPVVYLIVVLACCFEVGFYVLVALLAQPLLGALAWWNVAIGNAIAACAMGYYLWRQAVRLEGHPALDLALFLAPRPAEPHDGHREPEHQSARHPHDQPADLLILQRGEAPHPRCGSVERVERRVGERDHRPHDRHRNAEQEQIEHLTGIGGARQLRDR